MKDLLSRINKLDAGSWQNIVLAYAIKLVLVIMILVIGFWLINKLTKLTTSILGKERVDGTINSFFKTLLNIGLKISLVVFVLNFICLQTTSLVALVGAGGLVIGLAL